MCVIFTLLPGINIDDNLLDNAVANNWHGYGIVLKDDHAKRIEVRQSFSETNGADPEEVAKILRDNNDVTRYVHLRHTTKGANGLDNCHPFTVYHSNDRHVLLMHNGTMPVKFCPKAGDDRSDTRIFAEDFVSDLLLRFKGDMGNGDYNYPMIKTILEELAGYNNKLLLVSNDLDPLYCNHWSTIKNKDGSQFVASNNTYFDRITRGPRHTVTPFRTTSTQVARTGENLNGTGFGTNSSVTRSPAIQETKTLVEEAREARKVVPLKEVENSPTVPWEAPNSLLEALGASRKMFQDFGFDCLSWLHDEELGAGLKSINPIDLAQLFRCLIETAAEQQEELDVAAQQVDRLTRENIVLTQKHDTATKLVATLKASEPVLKKVG